MKTTNFALIENEFNAAIKSGDVTDDIINDILDEFLFFCDEKAVYFAGMSCENG